MSHDFESEFRYKQQWIPSTRIKIDTSRRPVPLRLYFNELRMTLHKIAEQGTTKFYQVQLYLGWEIRSLIVIGRFCTFCADQRLSLGVQKATEMTWSWLIACAHSDMLSRAAGPHLTCVLSSLFLMISSSDSVLIWSFLLWSISDLRVDNSILFSFTTPRHFCSSRRRINIVSSESGVFLQEKLAFTTMIKFHEWKWEVWPDSNLSAKLLTWLGISLGRIDIYSYPYNLPVTVMHTSSLSVAAQCLIQSNIQQPNTLCNIFLSELP